MLLALRWKREGAVDLLGDHGQDASVGMIGVGTADAAAQAAIKAFEATGCAQVGAAPSWVVFLNGEVGERSTEVTAQGGHSFGLAIAVVLHNLEGSAQDGGTLLGLKDGNEVAVDSAALAFAFWQREVFGDANGMPNVAELVEEAALLSRVKVDRLQSGAEAAAAIVDEPFQAVFAAQALFLPLAEQGEPTLGVFVVGQTPKAMSRHRLRRLLTGRRRPLPSVRHWPVAHSCVNQMASSCRMGGVDRSSAPGVRFCS